MIATLQILVTHYSRGSIVKLAEDHSSIPLAKFVISHYCGVNQTLQTLPDNNYDTHKFSTQVDAIGYAIRECERIRDTIAGGFNAGRTA